MIDSLITLLQWLLPTGSVGAVIVWLTSKTLRQARTAKEVHDTYKAMYEDVQGTLINLQHDNSQLHDAILRLEATIRRATECRYYGTCPLRSELQQLKARDSDFQLVHPSSGTARGQPAHRKLCPTDDHSEARGSECGQSLDDDSADQPP